MRTKEMILEMRNKIDMDHAETATELVKRAVRRFRRIEFWMYCLTGITAGIIIAMFILFKNG